ncbi:hypothetical protein ABZ461_05235 [Actinacidiphila glaucinigra]|uniref:hypothetical protein n=1 Tax=Actinacidiphila glaucinigra TaxID=235986 RepID=UPI0033F89F58
MADPDSVDELPLPDHQRRIKRSRLLFVGPWVLVLLALVLLVWEVVRGNLSTELRTHWPWRLVLLDLESASGLLAIGSGVFFARAQYAEAVRPIVGWLGRIDPNPSEMTCDPTWQVTLVNGGSHTATLLKPRYLAVPAGGMPDGQQVRWCDFETVRAQLTALGLRMGHHFDLAYIGDGAPLMSATGGQTSYIGSFTREFTEAVEQLYIRIRVRDVAGDTHERVLSCLRGAGLQFAAEAERERRQAP